MPFTIHPESPNKEAIPVITEVFSEIEPRLRELLPELTEDLQLYAYSDDILPEQGVGGFAYSPTTLSLSLDNDFADKALQRKELAATAFHEAYHLVQGHTGNDPSALYESALDTAIYEGCAGVFEREYAGGSAPFGDYSSVSKELLHEWANALRNITLEEWMANDGALWKQWSFYDYEDSQRWKAYKVGTWIVERYIEMSGVDIREMRTLSAEEINKIVALTK